MYIIFISLIAIAGGGQMTTRSSAKIIYLLSIYTDDGSTCWSRIYTLYRVSEAPFWVLQISILRPSVVDIKIYPIFET